MTTKEIAERLVALCRQGKFETAQKELYATDAIGIEPISRLDPCEHESRAPARAAFFVPPSWRR